MILGGVNINYGDALGAAWIWVFLVYAIIFLVAVYSLLRRNDFDTQERILWFLVVSTVPLFGMIFYWTIPPPRPKQDPRKRGNWLDDEVDHGDERQDR